MSQAMPQAYETLLLERRGRVALVTINRPDKRNALNIKTREEGAALLEELRNDSSVGVVVITGAGDKAFIAGADIGEFAGRTAMMQREVMMARSLFTAIDSFPKPVIAMVNGYCLGGGCELALACDLRIASETASFGQPEINLGIIPGGGGTQRLTRLVGEGKAMELILTGDIIDANAAQAIGLVNMVVPAEHLEAKRMAIANRNRLETEGLIGREQFARMKPTAFFITTARGPVHDESALYDALVSGGIAGAGIDVFHDEPPDPSHPLLTLDNVVASPHTAGITEEATRDIARATAEQWLAIFAGKVPPRLVNPEVWPAYADRFDACFGVRPEELPS